MSALEVTVPEACPCGRGASYTGCCGPLHEGQRAASTAEELMRSRYAAYVVGDTSYLLRTWHPRTRPAELDPGRFVGWLDLTVLATADGRYDDRFGEVEFRATHGDGVLHERSRFVRRAGRWVYVDGDLLD
ncbi:YchJ family protein [Pedococcus sp.]|uniref:YchJ family protein n=1 Tax=Pedococcus sp. TaxID=2860345 RepID=UPI002E0F2EA2|nr:YchJ family metal-binding protein [Pedococcus sp.]